MSELRKLLGLSWILVVGSLVLSSPAAFAKSHPYPADFVSRAQTLFFDGGKVSSAKVDTYIARLKQKREEIRSLHAGIEIMGGNRDPKKIEKKLDKEAVSAAFDYAVTELEAIKPLTDEKAIYDHVSNALETEAAFRIKGQMWIVDEAIQIIGNVLKSWKIPKNSTAAEEAADLIDPTTKRYLDVADIQKLKDQNVDLSLLQPPSDGPFWENPGDISRVDVERASLGATNSIYGRAVVEMPKELVFHYDEVKHNDTKPKMNVYTMDEKGKKKDKFKLKWGAEIHSDPTSSALLLTLGFSGDVVRYVRDVKVYLGKATAGDVKREWETYYSRDYLRLLYPIEKYVKSEGKDAGGNFIVFRDALIEAKPKELERIGGWNMADFGHTSLRTARGLTVVNLWLNNVDMQEFNNNRVILRIAKDGTVTRHMMLSDVGASLGSMMPENPDAFSWKMLGRQSEKSIDVNFTSFVSSNIKNASTLADWRWGARLIADLSREQIAKAVEVGRWPECARPMVVESLVARRNDLVKGLGLLGSRQLDGRTISLLPQTVTHDEIKIAKTCDLEAIALEDSTQIQFTNADVAKIIGRIVRKFGLATARYSFNSLRRFHLNELEIGISDHLITDAIVDIDRTIERNPDPKSEQDIQIVTDRVELGLRLGAQFGIYKDFTYTRSFTLVYPARSVKEAELNGGFLVNFLLPKKVASGNLPENYVLLTEHYLENGMGVRLEDPSLLISPVLKAGHARALLTRSIYDHRDPSKYILYRDRSAFTQDSLMGLVRLFIIKIPVFWNLHRWGTANGRGTSFAANELANEDFNAAVQSAVLDGDFSKIEKNEKSFGVSNEFDAKDSGWKLLFWGCNRSKELDRITMATAEGERKQLQFRTSRDCGRNFFGNAEQKSISVEAFSDENRPGTYDIGVKVMAIDTVTKEQHLENRYLNFINGLSVDGRKVIALTPSLGYTTNRIWGSTVTTSEIEYSEVGVARILAANESSFFKALASSLGVTMNRLNQMKKSLREMSRDRSETPYARPQFEDYGLTSDDAEALSEGAKFWKRIADLKKVPRPEEKIKKLTEALRQSIFVGKSGFYSPKILGALNRLAGEANIFSRNLITVPPFAEVNLLEGIPMYGEIGKPFEDRPRYVAFKPIKGVDLYTMFDTWF